MGIRIDGASDLINATDGSLTIEGQSINSTGIGTFSGGVKVGSAATIHSTGQFNIGVAATIFASGNATFSGIATVASLVSSGAVSTGALTVAGSTNVNAGHVNIDVGYSYQWGDSHERIEQSDGNIEFFTGNGEKMRLSGSRLLLGQTSADTDMGSNLQVAGSSYAASGILQARTTADGNGPALDFIKSRNTTWGSHTIVQDGDELGRIYFRGDDGVNYSGAAAAIFGEIDGTPGANDLPGRLLFYTSADGADSPTERLRITSTGNLLVGATAVEDWDGSRDHRIQVRGNTYQTAGISILDTQNDDNSGELVIGKSRGTGNTIVGSADDIGQIRFAANDGAGFHSIAWVRASMDGTPGSDDLPSNLRFGTSADGGTTVSERLRIDKNGQLVLSNGSMSTAYGNSICGGTNLELDTSGIIKFRTDTNQKMSVTDNGLCFGYDSAAANALDDYEYGTWTPTIEGQGSAGTATYPQRRGDYTKIGNRVFVNCYISYNSGSGSGNLLIAGLPFSVKNVSACDHAGGVMMSNITISNADDVCSIVSYTGNNLTKVFFYTTRSAATYTALAYDTSGEIIFSLSYNTK